MVHLFLVFFFSFTFLNHTALQKLFHAVPLCDGREHSSLHTVVALDKC